MDYKTQKELYLALIPAFNVKKRLLSITKYDISNRDIWTYLTNSKWKSSINLTLSEVANDIINVEPDKIYKFKGENKNEKR
jgi:hypothetical protein